jgi:lactoylglutathione lyase
MTDTAGTSRITGVRTIGVPVTDQEKALAFYTGTLGFTKQLDVPMGGGSRWIEVAPECAPTSIALVQATEQVPAGGETGVRLVTGDADAAHAELLAAGADVDDVLRWPGVPPMFAFRDQDGNGLEIVEQA